MSRILDSALATVWAITPDGLEALRAIYDSVIQQAGSLSGSQEQIAQFLAENEEWGLMLHQTSGFDVEAVGLSATPYQGTKYGTHLSNGVVVLDLVGPIYPRANMMTSSGAVSLQQFTNDFIKAYNDTDVVGLVLNVDSPGGDARGLGDATQMMYSYSKKRKKPVKTFASGYMASAAYYIGAVSQDVVGSKSSYVGSIGTVLKAKALGQGEYEITSSQSPYKRTDPSTEEGRSVIQEFVDDVAAIFIDDVAEYMNVSKEKVLSDFGQGKMFVGPRAKRQGLLNGISTIGDVVESVAKEAQTGSYRKPKSTNGRMSADIANILTFNSEEIEDMGLKDLVSKFTASNKEIEGLDNKQAPASTATAESEPGSEAVDGSYTLTFGDRVTGAIPLDATPEQVQAIVADAFPASKGPTRDELEEKFSSDAELFATKMTLASHILPAEQPQAASNFLIAKIDDATSGGTVSFVNKDGVVVEGTREEAVRASYEARPAHSYTQRSIVGLKSGAVAGKIISEESKAKNENDGPISADRKNELLGTSELGRHSIAQRATK